MQRVLHPNRAKREKTINDMIATPNQYVGDLNVKDKFKNVKVKTLKSTLGSMQTRFASGQKPWNPSEPKNHALGYAFKKHLTPIVQALIKPGDLSPDDMAKLQSMKDVIDAKLGVIGSNPFNADLRPITPVQGSNNPFQQFETLQSSATPNAYNPQGELRQPIRIGGRRKTRKSKTRKSRR